MSDSAPDHESRMGRMTEEVRKLVADGRAVDARALGRQFGVSWTDVQRCAAAIRALGAAAPSEPVAPAEPPTELPLPPLPADYELLGELGRGGMAVVYRARQRSLGRVVAVKVLRPGDLVFGPMQKRFLAEARALARLRHPHIVSVHEVGEAGANVFFSMDLVDGESLADVIRGGGMTPTRAVKLLRQVASAIAYSHANGLVHRDLKPGNILVDRAGDAFVVDFGLARDMGSKADMTGTGQLLGTPAYMSPEQARGDTQRIGEPADVYALGAVLYECLAGRPPFQGESLIDTIRAVVHDDPVPPRKLDAKVPPDLEVVCLKAMAKEPERRYATAQAFLEDLERFAEGREIRARPPSVAWKARKFVARHRTALIATGATALAAAVAFQFLIAPRLKGDPAEVLALAEERDGKGAHEFAATLTEDVLTRRGWTGQLTGLPEPNATAIALRERWAWARLGMARDLLAAGKFAESCDVASKTAETVVSTIPGALGQAALWTELHWAEARARAAQGDAAGMRAAIAGISSRKHFAYMQLAGTRVLDDSGPGLFDPAHANHRGSVLTAAMQLSDASDVWYLPEWFAGHVERATPAALELLRAMPEVVGPADAPEASERAGRLYGAVSTLLEEIALRRRVEVVTALDGLARDTAADPQVRTCAAELLAAFDDVPVWRDAPAGAPRADDAFVARVLAVRGELAALAPAAAAARRAEMARDAGPPATAWLDAHRELPAGTEPVALLEALLAAPGTSDPADIARARLHTALVAAAPDPARIPAWGFGHPRGGRPGLHEPQRLVRAWRLALDAAATSGAPVRVRFASFVLSDQRPPRQLWSDVQTLRSGDTVHVKDDAPVLADDLTCSDQATFTPHAPGPDYYAWEFLRPIRPQRAFEADVSLEGRRLSWTNVRLDLKPVQRLYGVVSWTGGYIDGQDSGEALWCGTWIEQRHDMYDGEVYRDPSYGGVVVTFAAIDEGPADAVWTWNRWLRAAPRGAAAALRDVPSLETWRRGEFGWPVPVALLALLVPAGWVAVRGLLRPRSEGTSLVPPALAVAAGVLASGMAHVEPAGIDFHTEWAALLVAAAGVLVLSRGAARWRWLVTSVAALIALSVVLSIAGTATGSIPLIWASRGTSMAGLALLGLVPPAVHPPRTRLGSVAAFLPVLVLTGCAVRDWLTDDRWFLQNVALTWLTLLILPWLVISARRASRARAAAAPAIAS